MGTITKRSTINKSTVAVKAYDKVRLARNNHRPTGMDYITRIFDDFIELHGDRKFADDPAIVGGLALLDGKPVTVIACEKGHTAKERAYRNFGAPGPEGYRKANRLMKQAEKFGRPVICFVDTSGAYCGIGAEERGQGQAIASNLMDMSALKVPVISIIIGEGGSGGALALAVADEVWMMENAVYSVISPEGCASILFKDAERAEEAAESLGLTAERNRELGVADRVVEEVFARNGFDPVVYENLKILLSLRLKELEQLPADELVERRYRRFRALGNR
ncbi:MAG: acetyl-CoA carboxylase carboxyltransferase subunit alpha [Firmicutes bacterium]|nr:acetyl-CoA carboxylase carboxyltransferase subunit alpha [Bacillota bacterium]